MNQHLDLTLVGEPLFILLFCQEDFPDTIFQAVHPVGIALPVVEISKQVQVFRMRRPLPVNPAFSFPVAGNPEIGIAIGKTGERSLISFNGFQPVTVPPVPVVDLRFSGFEPRILFDHPEFTFLHRCKVIRVIRI